jgi:hypothetical protein
MPKKHKEKKLELPKGFNCDCGRFNAFSSYVYAHWDMDLTFTCECGREYCVYLGKAEEM